MRAEITGAGTSFMAIALDEARKAAARGEVPIGAVIVRDGVSAAAMMFGDAMKP